MEKPLGYMVRWNRRPRYDEVSYFETLQAALAYERELKENGWTDPELIPLYEKSKANAPDMLTALKALTEWAFNSNPDWNSISTPDEVVTACAAIMKATDPQ